MPNENETEALCKWCQKPFERNRKDKVYCCSNCKTYAFLKAKRDQARELKQKEKKDIK